MRIFTLIYDSLIALNPRRDAGRLPLTDDIGYSLKTCCEYGLILGCLQVGA